MKTAVVEVQDRYTGVSGLGEFLRGEGVEVRDATDALRGGEIPDPEETNLFVVGSFATSDAAVKSGLDRAANALQAFVRNGGVVAILCQADQDRVEERWLEAPARLVRGDTDADVAYVEQANHPLLRGPVVVASSDLRGWRVPASWGTPNTLWETFPNWSEAGVILASGPPDEPRTAGLVEMAWGRGRVVVYAMAPDKAIAAGNNVARRGGAALLRNLVAYAATVRDASAAPVELSPPPRYSHPLEGTVFQDRNGDGLFDSGDTPLAGIPVSDGEDVTLTNTAGEYRLANTRAAAVFVFLHQTAVMSLSGQEFFHRLPAGDAGPQRFDFALKRAEKPAGSDGIRFVQLTDSHISNRSDRSYMIEATDEIYAMDPAPDFVVSTGDLVDLALDGHYLNYVAGMQNPPVPYFNVFGNHEISRGPISRYHQYIGPDYYSWESGGIVFLALNCITPSMRQDAWLTHMLKATAKGRPIVVFQHYPPEPTQLERFAALGVRSVFSGHWHSEKEVRHGGVQSVNSPPFIMGGIDASPAGFKVVHLKPDGSAETGWRYGFQKQRLTIVSPQEGEPANGRELPIIVNAYDSSHDVTAVTWSLGYDAATTETGSLSRESATAWTGVHRGAGAGPGSVPIRVEVRDSVGRTWSASRQIEFANGPPAAPVPDQEWHQFMGNAAHTGFTARSPALPLRLAWSVDTGGDPDFASPVLAGGRLFLALKKRTAGRTNGVAAFDPATGQRLWVRETETAVNHTPAIAGDTLCIAEMGGRIHGLEAATGQPRWHHDLIDSAGRFSYCAPALNDSTLYAGVLRRTAKLDPATGGIFWERRIGPADSDWISSYGSPAVHDGVLVMTGQFGRGESLVAVRAEDGEKLWGHPADGGILASATIAGDRVLFCTQKSILRCHRLADGLPLWEQPLGSDLSYACWSATTPAVCESPGSGIVVAGSGDGRMCGVDLDSGLLLWVHASQATTFKVSPYRRDARSLVSSPIIAGEVVFFGSSDGYLYCVSLRTGETRWKYNIGVPVLSTPLVTGNAVFAAAFDGRLYAWTGEEKFPAELPKASASNLVISEFSYNPASAQGPAEESFAASDFEFIELKNISGTSIDLCGVALSGAVDYEFASDPGQVVIPPGSRIVVVASLAAFAARYPEVQGVVGPYSGSLANSGDTIRLVGMDGSTIREISYQPEPPWPLNAAGHGFTVVLRSPDENPFHNDPANWRASTVVHGTPGEAEPANPGYAGWKAANGNPADDSDDDGDGLTAFAEYALGGTPETPDGDLLPRGYCGEDANGPTGRYFSLTFQRRAGVEDVAYIVESSSALADGPWVATNAMTVSVTPNGDGTATVVYRSTVPVAADQPFFLRLRLMLLNP